VLNSQRLTAVQRWNPAPRSDCLPGHDGPVDLPEPSVPQPPQASDRDETDPRATPRIDALEARLASLLSAVEKLAEMKSTPGPAGAVGDVGPRGPAGLPGPPGKDGRDGEIPAAWETRIAALEGLIAQGIDFELYDPQGLMIDREKIPLGGTLRLRLYPQTQASE
jgi:hypothetical protein